MATYALETDYLVIGSSAAGMAFTDSLITETDAQVIAVDRRAAPGGHWMRALRDRLAEQAARRQRWPRRA